MNGMQVLGHCTRVRCELKAGKCQRGCPSVARRNAARSLPDVELLDVDGWFARDLSTSSADRDPLDTARTSPSTLLASVGSSKPISCSISAS